MMAFAVSVQLGEWKGKLDFIIVSVDLFEAMLGSIWYDQYVMAPHGKGINMVIT